MQMIAMHTFFTLIFPRRGMGIDLLFISRLLVAADGIAVSGIHRGTKQPYLTVQHR